MSKAIDREYFKENLHDFYNKKVEVNKKGTDILENSADGQIRSLRLLGNGRKSKNLLDCSGLTEQTINGVTFTPVYNEKGQLEYINANGQTPNSAASNYIIKGTDWVKDNISGKQITINGCKNGSSNTYALQVWTNAGSVVSYDGDATREVSTGFTDANIAIHVKSNTMLDNVKFYPMIRLAEETDPTYEPYGLILSEGKVETNSKNLLDLESYTTNASHGITFTKENNASIRFNGVNDGATAYCYFMGTMTFSNSKKMKKGHYHINSGSDNVNALVRKVRNDETFETLVTNTTDGSFILQEDSNIWIAFSLATASSGATYEGIILPQLEEGDTATDFVPYQHTEINASDILETDFCGVGDIKDELIVNADGSGKFIKRVGSVDMGNDNFQLNPTATTGKTRLHISLRSKAPGIPIDTVSENILCSHLKNIASNSNGTYGNKEGISESTTGDIYIYIEAHSTYTIEQWKRWLTDNNVQIRFRLATPEITDLTPSQVKVLLSLKTFRDKTIITADCEHEIGYFSGSEVGQSLADINSAMWKQIQNLVS